ncbi:hypothetical protein [Halalkalicoccus salilacus]|uniref:hypothetical protein n=1 Tax=Halalkalicoccus salilacus TaxID=3117459 RepID=UPI00300F2ED2
MNRKLFGLALAAGVATFLIVGVAITEFAQPWVEFSLFLGIPVGFVAGAFTAAAVYFGLADDELAQRRHIAGAFARFGVVFLVVLIALGSLLNLGVTFDSVLPSSSVCLSGSEYTSEDPKVPKGAAMTRVLQE